MPGSFRQRRRQAQVGLARPQPGEQHVRAALHEHETDGRVRRPEVAQHARHRVGAQRVQERERHPAPRRIGLLRQQAKLGGESRERTFRILEKKPAVTGQLDGPPGPGEQRNAELRLEARDRARQRGLRDAQLLGGAGEVLLAGDGDELAEPGNERVEPGGHVLVIHIWIIRLTIMHWTYEELAA